MKKLALITGATSGIGKACATIFAENGYDLIITGRRSDRLHTLSEELSKSTGSTIYPLVFDVRDTIQVQQAMSSLDDALWMRCDVLVNNAGLAKGLDYIHEGQLDHWETMIDTNVKGLLYIARFVTPFLVRKRAGHIINIGSIAGKEVYTKGAVYCASKAAVDALTRGMRLDLHTFGIRVSQVSPGHVEATEFASVRFDGDEQRAKIYEDFQPLKSSDVADVIYYIATRPAHVNIQDVLLMGTQQASATVIDRSGRK